MKDQGSNKSRRTFLIQGLAGLAGTAFLPMARAGKAGEAGKQPGKKAKTPKIIYRDLGKTGFRLPVVSLGVMNAENPQLVAAALDAGIVYLDTAYAYQRGRNEEMIGQVVKDRPRDSYVIATKVEGWPVDRKTGLFTKETTEGPFLEKFETSLKRLGLEHVDILYLHSVVRGEAVLFEPFLNVMTKLKKQGKIRAAGVSTHSHEPEVIRAAADSGVYQVVLTAYNFRQPHRDEIKTAIAYAAKAGLGIVAMKTQAGVFADRARTRSLNMKAALKWALQDPNVHTSIPGMTTFDQLETDISVMEDLTLTKEEKADLERDEKIALGGLYCSQCDTCLAQCRKSIEIPTLMRSYMYAYGYGNLQKAKATLRRAGASPQACSGCSECRVRCTMGFDVRARVADIERLGLVPDDFVPA